MPKEAAIAASPAAATSRSEVRMRPLLRQAAGPLAAGSAECIAEVTAVPLPRWTWQRSGNRNHATRSKGLPVVQLQFESILKRLTTLIVRGRPRRRDRLQPAAGHQSHHGH